MTALLLFRQRVNQFKKAEADLKHAMQKLENAPSLRRLLLGYILQKHPHETAGNIKRKY
ncbi:Uncharacterised protein [Neisseria dentiae]|nr:Uncharacterised protein [Neisseria dentiae]STZ49941.1 Uncharacterised protein [Neisseria dentiae]